jgi:hypothetical protein
LTERTPTRAPALLLALGCTWGASFLFIKVIVDEVSPIEVVADGCSWDGRGGGIHARAALAAPLEPVALVKVSVMAIGSNVLRSGSSPGAKHIDGGRRRPQLDGAHLHRRFAAVFWPRNVSRPRLAGLVLVRRHHRPHRG